MKDRGNRNAALPFPLLNTYQAGFPLQISTGVQCRYIAYGYKITAYGLCLRFNSAPISVKRCKVKPNILNFQIKFSDKKYFQKFSLNLSIGKGNKIYLFTQQNLLYYHGIFSKTCFTT